MTTSELTEAEEELISAIRNYRNSYPNGYPNLYWYIMELIGEMVDVPPDC